MSEYNDAGLMETDIPILVVDDLPENLNLMELLLVGEGFRQVILADSGQRALEILAQRDDIGVVLLDLIMPEMDGYEVCQRISGNPRTQHIPIIVVTGTAFRLNEALQKSFAAGAMDFVHKALTLNEVELFARIRVALELYRERRLRQASLKTIADNETRFRTIINRAPVGIAQLTRDGRFLMVNDSLVELLGYRREELSQLRVADLVAEGPGLEPLQASLQQPGKAHEIHEVKLQPKNGEPLWAQISASLMSAEDGGEQTVVLTLEDITERKAARDELDRTLKILTSHVENSPLAVVEWDPSFRVTRWTAMAERIFGWSAEEVVGKHPRDWSLVHPEDQPGMEYVMAKLMSGEQPRNLSRTRNFRKDGVVIHCEWYNSAIFDEDHQLVSIMSLVQDVTARKHAEAALMQATQQAKAASQAKGLFLANMSHEMRTPLHAILGMTSMLLDTPLGEEQQNFVETIRTSSDALLATINDVLDLSKIESNKLELEVQPFDLRDCVETSLDIVAPIANQKRLKLSYRLDPAIPRQVNGDVARLRQVLLNLLSNAVKFTEEGGVSVEVQRSPHNDARLDLHFAIHDTGIGIPDKFQHRLFDAFSQADESTTRKYGGTGLGLAICKRLVTLMDGDVGVRSAPGQGSTFYFSIAVTGVAGSEQLGADPELGDGELRTRSNRRPPIPPIAEAHPLRILLAEDNPVNQKVAVHLLRKLGYRADVASNGQETLEAVERQPYDVVLLDVQMPVMDGLTAARELCKRLPAERRPYLIAQTAGVMPDERTACRKAGIQGFVGKPIKIEELAAQLQQVQPLSRQQVI